MSILGSEIVYINSENRKSGTSSNFTYELSIPSNLRVVIKIPSKAADMDKVLHKLLIAERKRFVAYVNQNPRNKMTDDKAHDIIEKLVR